MSAGDRARIRFALLVISGKMYGHCLERMSSTPPCPGGHGPPDPDPDPDPDDKTRHNRAFKPLTRPRRYRTWGTDGELGSVTESADRVAG